MSVRTARLAFGESGAANTQKVIFTCPAGVTAICKDWRITGIAAGPTAVIFGVRSGPAPSYIAHSSSLAFEQLLFGTGFIVLEPGDQLVIFTSVAAGARYWVSGSELAGVAP